MKVFDLSILPTFKSTYSIYSGGIFGDIAVSISERNKELTLIK
jgi:hypothetical protein